jgi:uncharacterized membrane protein YdjX (TVP38/TMEM64 family)
MRSVSGLPGYLVAFASIFAVNLLPAFGPPTWAVLVFFKLNGDLAFAPLVLGGALSAASGRLTLASGSRALRGRLSAKRRESLQAAEEVLTGDRRRALGGLALFALSPVPSAQLFVAAGLLTVRLLPLTAAFFAGRLVSYSLYVGGASLAERSLSTTLTDAFSSPVGIGLQVLMLAGVVALVRVDWVAVLRRPSGTGSRPPAPRPSP